MLFLRYRAHEFVMLREHAPVHFNLPIRKRLGLREPHLPQVAGIDSEAGDGFLLNTHGFMSL
jgi:hypothetical protein